MEKTPYENHIYGIWCRTSICAAEPFHRVTDMPAALERPQYVTPPRTHRPYEKHVTEFDRFANVKRTDDFCTLTRAHVMSSRKAVLPLVAFY